MFFSARSSPHLWSLYSPGLPAVGSIAQRRGAASSGRKGEAILACDLDPRATLGGALVMVVVAVVAAVY